MYPAIFILWFRVVAASYYFHEASRVIIKPDPLKDHQTFGFSMGYQNGTNSLIAGAPHSDIIGKVFQCPLQNIFINNSLCEDIHIDIDNSNEFTPNVNLNLGVSVAAASDYFLTCAPLLPLPEAKETGRRLYNLMYGSCFTYNGTSQRYHGMIERYLSAPRSVKSRSVLLGGTGWRTLVDQPNELLLIAKVSFSGDVVYVNSSNPLGKVTSLIAPRESVQDGYVKYFESYQLLGYSMTQGKFFDNRTLYAISATSSVSMEGTVHFLLMYQLITKKYKLKMLENFVDPKEKYVNIKDDTAGSMFGAAMSAADLNNDGLSELLVGAPAQGDQERGAESGAVHIYIGGDVRTINSRSRHRVIISSEDGSRFGATIATNDVDGDNYPEIFVSAPYEEGGVGAVYILSGYEVYAVVIADENKEEVALSKLGKTQKILHKEFQSLGYSLQSIPDMTNNGCDELAIGAPGTSEIMLLRCIPAVNVTVTAALVGSKIVKEQDNNFTVSVCIMVKHLKGKNFTIELKSTNEVFGNGAFIEVHQRSLQWSISSDDLKEVKCENVVVKLSNNEPGEFSFSTEVEMDEKKVINNKEFSNTWVMVSAQSLTKASFDISRHCTGKDCDPDLNVNITWAGSDNSYKLGSSEELSTILKVENRGNSSFEACVIVRVSGAPVSQISCGDHFDGYKCYMPKPLRRNAMHEVPIKLNMSHSSNQQQELRIQASLFELCNQPNVSKESELVLKLETNPEEVVLKSLGHNQTVTDVKIEDVRIRTINDVHEYWIMNEGSVTWKNTTVLIAMDKKPFIQAYRVSWNKCEELASTEKHLFKCIFDLMPNATVKIIATSVVLKSEIINNLKDKKLELFSTLTLYLPSNNKTIEKMNKLTSVIRWQKEKSLGQNKPLIIFLAILGALIGLAFVVFVLYKMEFFKRKEKTKLDALKQEHIRRQSVKRSMSVATTSNDGLDMEIDDDSPFEVVDITDPILENNTTVRDTKL